MSKERTLLSAKKVKEAKEEGEGEGRTLEWWGKCAKTAANSYIPLKNNVSCYHFFPEKTGSNVYHLLLASFRQAARKVLRVQGYFNSAG